MARVANAGSWKPHIEWPDEATLRDWIKRGDTLQVMGDRLGVTREAVRLHLKKFYNLTTQDETKAKIERGLKLMRTQSLGPTAAAKKVGLNVETIRYWAGKEGIRVRGVVIKSITHGTRTGYNRGCRCDLCTESNRHDQHIFRRRRYATGEIKPRRYQSYRSDRKPCWRCDQEGWSEPFKVIEQTCRFCGGSHTKHVGGAR